MSTYLLAFVVGEFDYVEDKTRDGVLVRVYTPIGKREQGLFALQVAVKTLPFYDGKWLPTAFSADGVKSIFFIRSSSYVVSSLLLDRLLWDSLSFTKI